MIIFYRWLPCVPRWWRTVLTIPGISFLPHSLACLFGWENDEYVRVYPFLFTFLVMVLREIWGSEIGRGGEHLYTGLETTISTYVYICTLAFILTKHADKVKSPTEKSTWYPQQLRFGYHLLLTQSHCGILSNIYTQ